MKYKIFLGFSILILTINTGLCQESVLNSTEKTDSSKDFSNSWDRFNVSFGGFLAGYNSGITLGSTSLGLGVVVDIEDALGIDVSTFAYRANVIYRFGKSRKHSLTAGYFGINRNATKTLEDSLQIGDIDYPVGTELSSKYNFSIIRLKYDYAFYQDDRVSLGASFGLFIMPLDFVVDSENHDPQGTKFIAPLPLIGLRSDFRISKKFYMLQNVELLYLSFTDFKGSLLDLSIMLEHKTFKNISFGLGINSNRVNVTIENPESKLDFLGDIRMDYTGILLYGRYFF